MTSVLSNLVQTSASAARRAIAAQMASSRALLDFTAAAAADPTVELRQVQGVLADALGSGAGLADVSRDLAALDTDAAAEAVGDLADRTALAGGDVDAAMSGLLGALEGRIRASDGAARATREFATTLSMIDTDTEATRLAALAQRQAIVGSLTGVVDRMESGVLRLFGLSGTASTTFAAATVAPDDASPVDELMRQFAAFRPRATVTIAAAPAVDPLGSVAPIDPAANAAPEQLVNFLALALTGSAGDERIRYTNVLALSLTLDLGDGHNTLDARDAGLMGAIAGGAGVDEVMLGLLGAGSVDLGAGDDRLAAAGFVGTVAGGAGNDQIVLGGGGVANGGDGDDTLAGTGMFFGDDGDDAFVADLRSTPNLVRSSFDGGAGGDTLRINVDAATSPGAVAALFAELDGAGGTAPAYLASLNLDLSNVETIEVLRNGELTRYRF